MSRIFEALRRAENERRIGRLGSPLRGNEGPGPLDRTEGDEPAPEPEPGSSALVALASLKGGVGKTVIAANLAVYLRDLRPDLPTLLLACDADPLVERMFASDAEHAAPRPAGAAASVIGGGGHGVFTLRPVAPALSGVESSSEIGRQLRATGWGGLVVVDTPPNFGVATRWALAASDLVLVPVSDRSGLDKAARLFALMDRWGLPRDRIRVLLSQIDLRIKYQEGESDDVLALLVSEVRQRGWPLLGAFLSRTPKVASLYTHPTSRPLPIAQAAPSSVVHQQFQHLAHDVLGLLPVGGSEDAPAPGADEPRPPLWLRSVAA